MHGNLTKTLVSLAALPVMALLAYGLTRNPKEIPSPLITKAAPAFRQASFDGNEVGLSDFRGSVVVINFWASWCYPACWNEAPRLEQAWKQYRDRGVVVVGINYQDREQDALAFIRKFSKSYPNIADPRGRLGLDYGVYGVPETFFVNREGKISHKHVGEISSEILTREIESLLAQNQTVDRKGGKSEAR